MFLKEKRFIFFKETYDSASVMVMKEIDMKAAVEIKKYKSGKCLAIYVSSKNRVNKLMLALADAGFIVNYEPRYVSGNYECCFLCGSENIIRICCKLQKK